MYPIFLCMNFLNAFFILIVVSIIQSNWSCHSDCSIRLTSLRTRILLAFLSGSSRQSSGKPMSDSILLLCAISLLIVKVYAGSDKNYKPVAQINLQGKGLEKIGFVPGTPIKVKREDGRDVMSSFSFSMLYVMDRSGKSNRYHLFLDLMHDTVYNERNTRKGA